MAIQARLAEYLLGSTVGWDTRTAINTAGVERCRMALLAQPGLTGGEQVLVVGAVGYMAIGAILSDRSVLEEKWTAFLGVAFVAGLVDRVARQ